MIKKHAAWLADLPCKNPRCKSVGKPHPNCKCYNNTAYVKNLAEGGEISGFCSEDLAHEKHCEYYFEGGDISNGALANIDPVHGISNYLAHHGLHGLLKMGLDEPDEAMKKYDIAIQRGSKKSRREIDKIFSGEKSEKEDFEKAHKEIDDWISSGGIVKDTQDEMLRDSEPQDFADGGPVKERPRGIHHGHPLADQYPQQNALLHAAKGRASEYLNGLKPQPHQPKLAFDDVPDQSQQKKLYNDAVKIAANPMRVLDKIKNGTLVPEHIQHLSAMYPEMAENLKQKLTERIVEAQVKGEKPPYKIRQAMSLFLGAPLSSEMVPENIRAAQACFQVSGNPQQKAPQGESSGKKSALSKSSQAYLTANSAAASRQQKQ